MFDVFGPAKGLLKLDDVCIDNNIFRLHYKVQHHVNPGDEISTHVPKYLHIYALPGDNDHPGGEQPPGHLAPVHRGPDRLHRGRRHPTERENIL